MKALLVLLLCSFAGRGCSQSNTGTEPQPAYKNVGGTCEDCDAIYEAPVPLSKLSWVDTLPDFKEQGPKLEISGTVYKKDGKTPAPGVVLYIYHTDQQGRYSKKGDAQGWGRRHGYIRGWVKTGADGRYKFYTLKPVSYPDSNIPAHIHAMLKEPDKNPYWIDEFLFDDDPFLTAAERSRQQNRCGSGILHLQQENGTWKATRNVLLGKNIPGYPTARLNEIAAPGLNLLHVLF